MKNNEGIQDSTSAGRPYEFWVECSGGKVGGQREVCSGATLEGGMAGAKGAPRFQRGRGGQVWRLAHWSISESAALESGRVKDAEKDWQRRGIALDGNVVHSSTKGMEVGCEVV